MSLIAVSQILLWIAVIGLALIVVALARQIGLLHERIAPAGALTLHQTIKPGDQLEAAKYPLLGGGSAVIGGARAGASQLLFFASPNCPICKNLFPVLRSVIRAEGGVEPVLASDGEPAALAQMVDDNGLGALPLVVSENLGRRLGVSKLPYAVLINSEGKIVSMGLINSREHLESLFVAQEQGVTSLQDFLAARSAKGAAHGQA